jgi:hypothetical protein
MKQKSDIFTFAIELAFPLVLLQWMKAQRTLIERHWLTQSQASPFLVSGDRLEFLEERGKFVCEDYR